MRVSAVIRGLIALTVPIAILGTAAPASAITTGIYYSIRPVHSGLCMDVVDGSTGNGARIQQWTCNGSGQQAWKFVRSGSYYRVENLRSGKCLDVRDGSGANGAALQQWTCNGSAQQKWWWVGVGGGYYQLKVSHSFKCADVTAAGTGNGVRFQQWSCFNSLPGNQKFMIP
jgi:hypothetical protein